MSWTHTSGLVVTIPLAGPGKPSPVGITWVYGNPTFNSSLRELIINTSQSLIKYNLSVNYFNVTPVCYTILVLITGPTLYEAHIEQTCGTSNETTLFCLIIVGYQLELCIAITFSLRVSFFYQLSHIIFFGVHTNYTKYDI